MLSKFVIPYHIFKHIDQHYIINIENMSAKEVDKTAAEILYNLDTKTDQALSPDIKETFKELNLIYDSKAKEKPSKALKTVPIVNISLFLTQTCNLRCIYCYGDGGSYGNCGSMDEKTAFQAVDWLIEQSQNMKLIHIGFFGGEPFLEFPLMKSVVEYAKKRVAEYNKNVDFHANTNGTLLEDEVISFIKDNNLNLLVSIDGPMEVQDSQRPYADGSGSFSTVAPKLKKLLSVMPKTPAHAVLVGDTDPQIVKKGIQEIGFKDISLLPASKSLLSEEQVIKSSRDTESLLQWMENDVDTWLSLIKNRDKETLMDFKAKSVLLRGIFFLLNNKKNYHPCGAGRGMVAVSVSGDVYLCHRFVGRDEYKLGNIFAGDLNRESYQISPITVNEKCASCFAKYYCAGGCRHDNASSCGSIETPSEDMCKIKCRELELSAVITSQLNSDDYKFLMDIGVITPKPCLLDF